MSNGLLIDFPGFDQHKANDHCYQCAPDPERMNLIKDREPPEYTCQGYDIACLTGKNRSVTAHGVDKHRISYYGP